MSPAAGAAGPSLRMGFGLSGALAVPFTTAEYARRLVRTAFNGGVRVFDTAPVYGAGEAERRLGAGISCLPRDSLVLSTKAGHVFRDGRRMRDFSPEGVRASITASLERLRTDRIDWLFLHGPAPKELTEDLLRALEAERASGRIAGLGIAGRGGELDAAIATGSFSLVMTPVHQGLDAAGRARIMRMRGAGLRVIGIEAMAGLRRAASPAASPGAAFRLARRLAGRAPAMDGPVVESARAALHFALGAGGADLVISTTTRSDRLAENIRIVESAPEALDCGPDRP